MKTRSASWDDLRFLLAVHRERSFFSAGKSLGVAASTVARRVEAVERSLGCVLVHRNNDGTQLDPDALRLVALAEQLELGLATLIRDGRDAEVSGTVRVSLSEGFVRPLVPLLARLQVRVPPDARKKLEDQSATARSLRAMLERPAKRLIVGHGDIIEERCHEQLAQAWRLEGVEV